MPNSVFLHGKSQFHLRIYSPGGHFPRSWSIHHHQCHFWRRSWPLQCDTCTSESLHCLVNCQMIHFFTLKYSWTWFISQSFINYTLHIYCIHCLYPYFSMSPTVPNTPLSGTQLMLTECKLLIWQQTSSSPRSQTFQMGFELCPYLCWAKHCQRM